MKMGINNLVNSIKNIISSVFDLKAQEASLFVSFHFACVYIRKFGLDQRELESRYQILYRLYVEILNKVPYNIQKMIFEEVETYCSAMEAYNNEVSWIYQALKESAEREAFKAALSQGEKLEGQRALVTTQFFTDDYMVDYLVRNAIDWNTEDLTKVCFVDPACGGGNFLTKSFDYLYKWYSNKGVDSVESIVDAILMKNIIGYDLDTNLGKVANLSLFLHVLQYCVPAVKINVYGADSGDVCGFLDYPFLKRNDRYDSFDQCLISAQKERKIVYITNPPFMGRRDMGIELKNYLSANYPLAKNDLCVSFVNALLITLNRDDAIAIVSQNSWLHLSSYKDFRHYFLANYDLLECVDLGSKSFERISGEKANVVLLIIRKKKEGVKVLSNFYNLRNMTFAQKQGVLQRGELSKIVVDCNSFTSNESYEFNYAVADVRKELGQSVSYGIFASCMQGTSTGNNKDFVKFVWEPPFSVEWKLVSKGGGFSKWCGLNYYKVKWGDRGELIKGNKGSALRNVDHILKSELVYSDTGTLGLNVRLRLKDQLFIASGPGIRVIKGDYLCHLGFLNSRFVSLWLKNACPKLTISAGYIEAIPTKESILTSRIIAKKVKECMDGKKFLLSKKLPNIEYTYDSLGQAKNSEMDLKRMIITELKCWLDIYNAEMTIENEIVKLLSIDASSLHYWSDALGKVLDETINDTITVSYVDKLFCKHLDENCLTVGHKLRGLPIGSSNLLELVSFDLGVSPMALFKYVETNIAFMPRLLKKYKLDITHKIVLNILGIKQVTGFKSLNEMPIGNLVGSIMKDYSWLVDSIEDVQMYLINDLIIGHHRRSFMQCPLITIDNGIIKRAFYE